MSEQDDRESGIRRVTRKDRKRKIDTRGPLFPPEGEFLADEPEPIEPLPPDRLPEADAPARPLSGRFPPMEFAEPERTLTSALVERPRSSLLPNLVTILFLIATVVMLIVFVLIAIDPRTPLNPFPPFTPMPIVVSTTPLPPTPTLPATQTPEPTGGPTATFTPLAASALESDTQYPFTMIVNAPIPNGNGQGCNWSSIAGSVTDAGGAPLNGYKLRVTGDNLDETVTTGAALTYGAGGFELPLGQAPREAEYTVQLFSPDEQPLSSAYPVATYAECERNVSIVSFVQTPT